MAKHSPRCILKTQKRCIQPRWHGTKPPNCPCLKKCKRGSHAILEVKTQVNATPSAPGHSLSASRLATIAGHTPCPNHYLRSFGRTPSQTKRLGAHVGSSCGASSGKQSHQHNHTLSPCNRRKWRANRLCGRTEKESVFAQCRAWQYFAT